MPRKAAPYFVYLLRCADGSLYTGITTDVKRRFAEHKAKRGGSYTRSHEVRQILRTERYPTRAAALKREAEIKRWRREQKLVFISMNRRKK